MITLTYTIINTFISHTTVIYNNQMDQRTKPTGLRKLISFNNVLVTRNVNNVNSSMQIIIGMEDVLVLLVHD